jgi:drug/metabolite transporter (DMT)-like permease
MVIGSESRSATIAFDPGNRLRSNDFMRTSPLAIICFVVAAFLGALGQFFYKSGAERTDSTLASYFFNARLLGGVVCYVVVIALFVAAFKRGGALTVLYPIYASTFIFAAIIAWFAYGTPIRAPHFAGFALLIAGMYLLGR